MDNSAKKSDFREKNCSSFFLSNYRTKYLAAPFFSPLNWWEGSHFSFGRYFNILFKIQIFKKDRYYLVRKIDAPFLLIIVCSWVLEGFQEKGTGPDRRAGGHYDKLFKFHGSWRGVLVPREKEQQMQIIVCPCWL